MPFPMTRRAFHASMLGLAARLSAQQVPCTQVPPCSPFGTGTPVPFAPETGITSIPRQPLSSIVADANATGRLRLAYQKLRDLAASDPSDPRGWAQQGNVHCWFCGGEPDQADIHQSWTFLPWHRCYLYYHERILCELLGDPTFRLPFWDWDEPASRNLPTIYRTSTANGKTNSLFDAKRGVNNNSTMPLSVILPNNVNAMNAPDFTTFGGDDGDGGQLENTSHGMVHVWTSNPRLNPSRTDMGCLPTAAYDPIFFAHHGNIDHLWAEWNRRDTVDHTNPTDPAWLGITFNFFDQNKVLRSIKVSDVLDTANNLGYTYPPGAGLAHPNPPKRFDVTLDQQTHSIRISDVVKNNILGVGALNATRFLVLQGVTLPSAPGLYYIYAGNPPKQRSAAAPNYLGFMSRLPGRHEHSAHTSMMLNAGKGFAELASAASGTQLTYVPTTGPLHATKLEFRNVYLVER